MNKKINLWFYVSLLPIIYASVGFIISLIAHWQQWGAERELSSILRIFFYETTFVISVLGLVSYLGHSDKNPLVKKIRWLNTFLVILSLLLSIQFFLL